MNTWTRTLVVGVALLAGCEGSIGGQNVNGSGAGTGSGTGNTSAAGTGNTVGTGSGNTTGTGTAGSGVVPPPVDPTVCTPGVPATSQLPRLTRAEYDKTTRDLLGLDVQPLEHAGARHARQRRPARLGWLQDGGRLARDAGAGDARGEGEGAAVHDRQRHLHPAVHHRVRAEGVPPPAHDGGGDAVPEPLHQPRDADRRAGRSIRRSRRS